jgi:CubicO group peptidase (beta-lactamase class C family)
MFFLVDGFTGFQVWEVEMFTLHKSASRPNVGISARRLGNQLLMMGLAALIGMTSSARAAPDEQDGRLLDELIGRYVSADSAPGAAAVLVRRDGRVTLRGYGVADLAAQRAVDPETTVFRIGSISKTFTAIAILQLMDEGKLVLEDDANRYLKGVQIPGSNSPVRVIDLLTHRAGFDGELTFVGLDDRLAAAQSTDARFQRDIFRIRPAGMIPAYDNMAWGLLGHIIESIDGVPYSQAIAKRIFAPLGMTHSQVGLPDDLSNVAVPYEIASDGKPHAKPQIYLRRGWQGAGDLSTTASDMTHFLQAMLGEGVYPGGRLLKAETFRRQTDILKFSFHPGVRGTGLGVYGLGQLNGGGFGHGGTIRGFNASLVVLPKQDLALFAVMNLNSPAPEMSLSGLADYIAHPPGPSVIDPTDYMTIELPYLLEQRFQPDAPAPAVSAKETRDWSGRYVGIRPESYEALLPRVAVALLLPPKTVRTQVDGKLFVNATGPYVQTAPGLYSLEKPTGPLTTTIGFSEVGANVLMGPHTLQASRRLLWYERGGFTVGGLLLAPMLLIGTALLHRRKIDSLQRRNDGIQAWAALALLIGIGAELSMASRWQRVESLGWVVSAWRIGVGTALLVMMVAAALALRRAFASSIAAAKNDSHQGRTYALAMIGLTLWIWFAAIYWHFPIRLI